MMINLRKQARTTPAVRAEIAASTDNVNALVFRCGVTEATIYKWKSRESVQGPRARRLLPLTGGRHLPASTPTSKNPTTETGELISGAGRSRG